MKRCVLFDERSKVKAPAVSPKELKNSEFYQPSTLDSFYCRFRKNPDGSESIRMTSDIYMLLNQKRLDRLTNAALVDHFNQMSVRDSAMASLRKKCTDEQLCSLVKSRYIQTPSELLGWSEYLNTLTGDQIQAVLQAEQDKVKQQQRAQQPEQQAATAE